MPEDSEYDLELEYVIETIRKENAQIVGLQFPEGLKLYAIDVARRIENETCAKTVIFIDPVYGACDTKEKQAEMIGVDLVIHFGHTPMKPYFA